MNSNVLRLFSFLLLWSCSAFGKQVTIVSQGNFTFSPDSVSIVAGDTVVFQGSSLHPIVEVSQSTWLAFGTTSNGGFGFSSGSGMFIPSSSGIYYFVCGNHGGSGMRGRIFVGIASGISSNDNLSVSTISVYPNPTQNFINIIYKVPVSGDVSVSVFNILGKEVRSLYNGIQQAGSYQKQCPMGNDFASGVYFVKVTTASKEFIAKLILQ